MARPQKIGLDYFPLDTDIDQDDKVAIIEAQHGMLGFAITIKLLMKIYSEGYYYDWTEKEQILFSKRVNVDINQVNVIIDDCVKWGLFDEKLFNEYKILTSKGIQSRYFEAVKRRQRVEIAKEFLLLDDEIVNVYNNLFVVSINDDINEEVKRVDDNINPQSKVKESKVNKIKVKESNNNITAAAETKIENPVADIGADPIQQDDTFQRIEDYYTLKVKRRCSGKDITDIYETYQKYKDIDFIFKVIEMAVERNINTHGKLTIKSFSYFIPIFQEEWDTLNTKKEGANYGSAPRDSGKNFKIDKSKFLWNRGEN